MRVLLCGLVVSLMLVASASAAGTGHLTMTVGGSSTYEPAPGETFTVDVNLATATSMTAWGMELRDEADAGYTIAASVAGGYMNLFALNYADSGPPWVNTAGWDCTVATAKAWPAGDVDGTRPGTAALDLAAGASGGWTMWFELTAPASEAGVVTRIVLDDLYAGDLDYDGLAMTYDALVLTPEPTSALLLLGALPLLLRRRR